MTDATRGAFTVYSLAELGQLEFPEPSWVIDDLIPSGSLTLLVGRPKAGKSLLALDMLASLAQGEPFLGRSLTRQQVIYGSAEDALPLVRARLAERCGLDAGAPLLVMPFDGSIDQWLRIDEQGSFAALVQTLKAYRPALVVLDPLREIHNQPENDADAMAAVLRPTRQLAHEFNCAIVIIHHRNKHGADPSTAARGSSAIVGSVDQTITLDVSESGPGDHASAPVGVLVEGRYGPRQRFAIQLGAGLRWTLTGDAPDDVPTRLLAALRASPEGLTTGDLTAGSELTERTIQRHLNALLAAGQIERRGAGNRYAPYTYHLPTLGAADNDPGKDPTGPTPASQPRVVESIRTCRTCGGNLWHEVAPEVWRCANCRDEGLGIRD